MLMAMIGLVFIGVFPSMLFQISVISLGGIGFLNLGLFLDSLEWFKMTEKQCYSCKYYTFEVIHDLQDEWCSKDNKYFMRKGDCPNYDGDLQWLWNDLQ